VFFLLYHRVCLPATPLGKTGLSNFLCEAPPRPFICECAVSGGARHGTLTHFSGVGRPSPREAGENWKALPWEKGRA